MITIQTITIGGCTSMAAIALVVLSGCANQDLVSKDETTIPAAMTNVADGLMSLKARMVEDATNQGLNSNYNFGLMPSSVVVNLQLSASRANSNQLMVTGSVAPTGAPASGTLGDNFSSAASGSRASSITITYSSLYFNPNAGAAVNITTNYVTWGTNSSLTVNGAKAADPHVPPPTGGALVAAPTTNTLVNSTNYSWTHSETKPSNLNDPDIASNMIQLIKHQNTQPGPEATY